MQYDHVRSDLPNGSKLLFPKWRSILQPCLFINRCTMQTKNVIIIGSGVAGMASAIRLALQGYTVKVFEKNSYPGGKLSDFEMNGYRFDAGPSLFTQPQNIEELFALAGEPIEDYFTYRQLPVSCGGRAECRKCRKCR